MNNYSIGMHDIVEVYKWKKPRYLGRVIARSPVGRRLFYRINVLSPIKDNKSIHYPVTFAIDNMDIVPDKNTVKICNGCKTIKCDTCKYRFVCFTSS